LSRNQRLRQVAIGDIAYGSLFHSIKTYNDYPQSIIHCLLIAKTLITSILLKGANMKYVQIVVEDAWLIKLKKKCLDEGVTLAQKLLTIIEREIGEIPWTQGN